MDRRIWLAVALCGACHVSSSYTVPNDVKGDIPVVLNALGTVTPLATVTVKTQISGQLTEIGSFDTFLAPAANSAGTDGAWGVYPFLPSGTIIVSDIVNGLYMLRRNETLPPPPPPPVTGPNPPAGGGGGGAGGGALDLALLLFFAGFAMLRARRNPRA